MVRAGNNDKKCLHIAAEGVDAYFAIFPGPNDARTIGHA